VEAPLRIGRRSRNVHSAVGGALAIVAGCATLAVAGCGSSAPTALALTGGSSCVAAFPSPGTATASRTTQISLRGVAPSSANSSTVSVTASSTGTHTGRWVADSDGQGASFYPSAPFARGERVTVHTGLTPCGGRGATATFSVSHVAGPLTPATGPASTAPAAPLDQPTVTYASAPALHVPQLDVKVATNFGNGTYLFETPGGGTTQHGLMIMDGHGQAVWFHPLPGKTFAADFRAQTYEGQPVLTWWQGLVDPTTGAPAGGEWVIMDRSYKIVRTLQAPNGLGSDEHEFLLNSTGTTAWITSIQKIGWNLSKVGGPSNGSVVDNIAQEVDLKTGNVLFEWHSLDHVPVTASYFPYTPTATYDYFHLNSIEPEADGTVVMSARHTYAAYSVRGTSGATVWQLGGKHSSFTMGPGTTFALQHDARVQDGNTISIFDDEDAQPNPKPARAIILRLDFTKKTATLIRALNHNGLMARATGNQQILPDGTTTIGWGFAAPGYASKTSVYAPNGTARFDAAFGTSIWSYRAFLLPWTANPTTAPSAVAALSGGTVHVYASWNGATQVARWQVVGGPSASDMSTLGSAPRFGFQTAITAPASTRFAKVVAIDADGRTLAASPVVAVRTSAVAPEVVTP
jgi:hypothetical protein